MSEDSGHRHRSAGTAGRRSTHHARVALPSATGTRLVCSFLLAAACILAAPLAHAHHGWAWTTGKSIELSGRIETVRLGNPHGLLDVEVEGATWTVEVGQPWRNERAGIREGDLAPGVEIRVIGEPASGSEKRLKAVRLYLGGREHVLYPDRN